MNSPGKQLDHQLALPPESPLELVRHQVHESDKPLGSGVQNKREKFKVISARLFLFGLTLSLSVYGVTEMYAVLSTNTVTILQWAFLILFGVNFIWISFASSQALLGFLVSLWPWHGKPTEADIDECFKTAILMPVYCEEPARVAAAIRIMQSELASRAPGQYAIFILSDTNDPDAWINEENVFRPVLNSIETACPVYYRKRLENAERKAGNIADWVRRWGGAYPAMIILDADSIMSVDTMQSLSRRMMASPGIGLIQTLPKIVRAKSLFGRLQQFANQCYGPIYARGLSAWHGVSSNFWGHNAILRTQGFAEACILPILPGKPPMGGHVLSHDFIEASFLRRAGWGVRFDTDLDGSYEEAPPSLMDMLVRDRRWCQGNLQHSRILFAKGLSLASRIHILSGIFSYLSAVFWLFLILLGLAIAIQALVVRPEYFSGFSLFPIWPVFDAERALNLFYVSMAVVFAPKVFGWFSALVHFRQCQAFGGPIFLTLNTLWESLLSMLYAPVLMVAQFGLVSSVLLGRDSGWTPQSRSDGALDWTTLWRAHRKHIFFGVFLAGLAYLNSLALFLWLLPITAGLLLSLPLSWISGGNRRISLLGKLGFLRAPEEKRPCKILRSLEDVLAEQPEGDSKVSSSLDLLMNTPGFFDWHRAQLPQQKGEDPEFQAAAVTAEWKIRHADSLQKLDSWLEREELLALMSRRDLLLLIRDRMN